MMILILIIDTVHLIDLVDGIDIAVGTLHIIVLELIMDIAHIADGIDTTVGIVMVGMAILTIHSTTIMAEGMLTLIIMDVHHHLGEQAILTILQQLMRIMEAAVMAVIMDQDVLVV